jgi:peptidoglycan hydrolase CwlO-like protein
MNAKTGLSCLLGVLMLTLTACGSAELMREKDRENTDLRSQVEQLRLQARAKDDEARKLAGQLAEAKKLQTQVAALEDRLRVMDDMMMSKSEDIAKLEAQLATAKEAAAAAAVAKPAPTKKRKSASAMKSTTSAAKAPAAPAKAKDAPSMPVDVMGKATEAPAKAPAADAKP